MITDENLIFYTIKNLDSQTAFISAIKGDGEVYGKYYFEAYDDFIAMDVWPSSGNYFIAITRNDFYFIDADTTPPSVMIVPSDRPLDKGLALFSKINDDECIYAVPDPKWPRPINHFSVNRGQGTVVFSFLEDYAKKETGPCLPVNVRGVAFSNGKLISANQQNSGQSTVSFYKDDIRNYIGPLSVSITDIAIPVEEISQKQVQDVIEVNVSTREYDAETLLFSGEVKNVDFGSVQPNNESEYKIIDMRVTGATEVSNVRLGIVDCFMSKYGYNENLLFSKSQSLSAIPSFTPFSGVNVDEDYESEYNKSVDLKTSSGDNSYESEYVFLKVSSPHNFVGNGHFVMKWFFEYE
jgi:hypothetical protein